MPEGICVFEKKNVKALTMIFIVRVIILFLWIIIKKNWDAILCKYF